MEKRGTFLVKKTISSQSASTRDTQKKKKKSTTSFNLKIAKYDSVDKVVTYNTIQSYIHRLTFCKEVTGNAATVGEICYA